MFPSMISSSEKKIKFVLYGYGMPPAHFHPEKEIFMSYLDTLRNGLRT